MLCILLTLLIWHSHEMMWIDSKSDYDFSYCKMVLIKDAATDYFTSGDVDSNIDHDHANGSNCDV